MKVHQNKGFTLVELMIGMASAAVLAVVFSALLFYGYKGWKQLRGEADMQADADVAMRTMDRICRTSSNAYWNAGTATLILTNAPMHTFAKVGSNLVWSSSGVTTVLITNRVGSFVCAVTNSTDRATLSVSLGLTEGYESLDMPFSIFMRN